MPPTDAFVGRHREIDALLDALGDTRRGAGGLVLIAGEPGIGKTRIVTELSDHDAGQDAVPLWGRCHEDEGAPPYWPWVQVLRAAAAAIRADDDLRHDLDIGAPDILELVPALRSRLRDIEPPAALSDPAQTRFRLFGSVARFLVNAARRTPLVVVLDDLHWADVPSLRLLEHLAQELAESRILVVGTYRDTDLSRRHRLSDTLGALARTPRLVRLHLTGLGAEDVDQFITSAAGVAPPAWLARAIHDQTEGNPLFVREVTRLLADQGHFAGKAVMPRMRLPEGVREVIGRRLNLLSPACNEILALGAVIGRAFDRDALVRAAADRTEVDILELLDEALTARIIEETDTGHYQFTHTLVRATLYDELRAGQRRRMHHAVGETLERLHARNRDPVLADLSHHFRMSGLAEDTARAIDYTTQAGIRADAAFAFEDAITSFQNALDLTDEPVARFDLLLRIGNAQRKAGALDDAQANIHIAADIARRLDDPLRFAAAALAYDEAAWRNDMSKDRGSGMLLHEALGRLPQSEIALRAKLLSNLARGLLHLGETNTSARLSMEAVDAARASGDSAAIAHAFAGRSDWPWVPAETETMLAEADAMLEAARHAGEFELQLRAQLRRAPLLLELNHVPAALEALEDIDRLNARTRQPLFMLMGLVLQACMAMSRGNLVEAERCILATRDRRLAGAMTTDPVAMPTFDLLREQGRLRVFAPVVKGILSQDSAGATWQPGLALLCAELSDFPAARLAFDEARAMLPSMPERHARRVANLMYLTEACAALEDRACAAELYALLRPWAGRNLAMGSGTGFWGAADRCLGMLVGLTRNFTAAEAHFETALRMNQHNGLHLSLAHTHIDYARMLLARDGVGDQAAARQHLDAAEALAATHGLTGVAARIARQRDALVPSVIPAVALDRLTTREIDVLRLIAIGRNNADIALVLSIGQSTVATHVHNILGKTGCANRTEAAAYAVRHGIVEPR